MIIVVSPSFEDHCAGNKDPETDGGPSEQTHKPKGPSIKVFAFFMGMGWDVSVSISLSVIGKTISQSHKTHHKHRSCQSKHSV